MEDATETSQHGAFALQSKEADWTLQASQLQSRLDQSEAERLRLSETVAQVQEELEASRTLSKQQERQLEVLQADLQVRKWSSSCTLFNPYTACKPPPKFICIRHWAA